jgi:hypothetical protein
MSQESFLRERIARLDCTADFLCSLTGIPATRLSQAFRGIKALPGPDAEKLNKTLSDLDELVKAFSPVPVKLENPMVIGELLEDSRNRQHGVGYSFSVANQDRKQNQNQEDQMALGPAHPARQAIGAGR